MRNPYTLPRSGLVVVSNAATAAICVTAVLDIVEGPIAVDGAE